jgi:hypothetical protein
MATTLPAAAPRSSGWWGRSRWGWCVGCEQVAGASSRFGSAGVRRRAARPAGLLWPCGGGPLPACAALGPRPPQAVQPQPAAEGRKGGAEGGRAAPAAAGWRGHRPAPGLHELVPTCCQVQCLEGSVCERLHPVSCCWTAAGATATLRQASACVLHVRSVVAGAVARCAHAHHKKAQVLHQQGM